MQQQIYHLTKNISGREKMQMAGAVLFLLTLPFYRQVNQIFYAVFLLSCIPLLSIQLWQQRKKVLLPFVAVYFVLLITGLYAPNPQLAGFTLEIYLALFLTPLMFGVSYSPSKQKNLLLQWAFVAGVLIALLYLMAVFLIKMLTFHVPIETMLDPEHLNHRYSAPIGIHASFFSTYIALYMSFILRFWIQEKRKGMRIFFFFMLFIAVISLFLLLSRIVLVVYGFCFLIYFFLIIRSSWIVKLFFGMGILFTFVFFAGRSAYFKERFDKDIQKDLKWKEWKALIAAPSHSAADMLLKNDGSRIERWVASLQLIRERPVFGYGTGQEKPVLFKKYKAMGLTVTLKEGYDSHNQFFSIMIQSGIFGLLALTGLFATGFYISFKSRDFVYFIFLFVSLSVCMVDNYLNANKGIFFFSFFNTFFAIDCLNRIKAVK